MVLHIVNGYNASGGADYDLTLTLNGLCTSDNIDIPGCTDPTAATLIHGQRGRRLMRILYVLWLHRSYGVQLQPESTEDDGSCEFTSCAGCTDPWRATTMRSDH